MLLLLNAGNVITSSATGHLTTYPSDISYVCLTTLTLAVHRTVENVSANYWTGFTCCKCSNCTYSSQLFSVQLVLQRFADSKARKHFVVHKFVDFF